MNQVSHICGYDIAIIYNVCCFPAPGSPPTNFGPVVIGSSSILFSWSRPAIPNGQIISYTVTYNLTGLPTPVVVLNATEYLVAGLEAYTYYQFTLFASTIVGGGPATQPLLLRTDIASKQCMYIKSARSMLQILFFFAQFRLLHHGTSQLL